MINNNKLKPIIKRAFCGSLNSSDCLITIEPNLSDIIQIIIQSPFEKQFGEQMRTLTLEILKENNVTSCKLLIQDQGALEIVLKSRILVALERART
ncbi:MAG: citrate lyase acyl carrier protein [Candidatus Phytoplasma australasiaticum]|nr:MULTISPECIES: citrate lyase acyl carrier protein [Phytoplasma]MCG3566710.1 citrate lyase acyl carrier protein [Sesame phyllody phytoplasma]MDO8031113.1 citrate lyase acyl carrier protein [Candidatus Phytoplasma australasiaticum]MDO8031759.1 citrate lyase acyl carrier protein [Candidatus Phytoplasma australasiaticum]MDO8046622.1 citrate lyase acyl carrier protein [Candidatus Phytoplasma australasiaticum]MDO8053130.1 citrate lyase acyl carrier protein [Candidatus Phytoplasma australasiaticum]